MVSGHIFMAMSLDGFVARADHALDWLTKQKTDGEDHGYEAFVAEIDGLVMGSGTFRTVLSFETWPYEKPVVVMSHSITEADIPAALRASVRISKLSPAALMASLQSEGWQRAYVDGGQIVHSFLKEGLIADMTVTIIPILIGEGRRMFGKIAQDIDLEMVSSSSYASGFVQTRYKIG